VIGLLRGWHSLPGQHTSAEVELGGARFAVVVSNSGREYLTKAMKPAVRYDGRVHDKVPFAIWISDDAARVPLAFRAETPIGAVAIELVDYQISAP
jgi:hypothetical protein